MKHLKINETIRIPGTDLILEAGDKVFFKEADSDIVDDLIKVTPGLDNFPSVISDIRSDIQKMKSMLPDLKLKVSKENHQIDFEFDYINKPLYGHTHMTSAIGGLDPKTKELIISYGTVTTSLTPLYGYSIYGIEEIEKYLSEINLKGKKVKDLLDRFFSRDFKKAVYKAFGKSYIPETLIGYWLQVCLSSGSLSNLLKTIENTPGKNLETKWAKMLSEAYRSRNSARLPLKSILLNKEKILTALCDPIETYVFGKPVTSAYL